MCGFAFLGVKFPGKGRGKKRDGVHTGNFNYTLFLAEFGQLIPRLPSLCGHRRREAIGAHISHMIVEMASNVALAGYPSISFSTFKLGALHRLLRALTLWHYDTWTGSLLCLLFDYWNLLCI